MTHFRRPKRDGKRIEALGACLSAFFIKALVDPPIEIGATEPAAGCPTGRLCTPPARTKINILVSAGGRSAESPKAPFSIGGLFVGVCRGLCCAILLLLMAACTASPGPVATPYPTLPRPLPTLTPGPLREAEFYPTVRPVAARGASAYATQCETCHASTGHGDTALGRTLSPRPTNFHDLEFLRRRTPSSLYRSISKGVLGTGMLAFDSKLTEAQRWDVWAYTWNLHFQAADIQTGSRLYADNCAACHGAQGEGGSGTALGDPRLLAGRTGYGMFNAISGGLSSPPDHQWTTLSEADRWSIIEYIWTFMYERQ